MQTPFSIHLKDYRNGVISCSPTLTLSCRNFHLSERMFLRCATYGAVSTYHNHTGVFCNEFYDMDHWNPLYPSFSFLFHFRVDDVLFVYEHFIICPFFLSTYKEFRWDAWQLWIMKKKSTYVPITGWKVRLALTMKTVPHIFSSWTWFLGTRVQHAMINSKNCSPLCHSFTNNC